MERKKVVIEKQAVFAGIDFLFPCFRLSHWTLKLFPSQVNLKCEREWGSRHNEFVYLKRFLSVISLFIAYSVISRCLANLFLSSPNLLLYPSFRCLCLLSDTLTNLPGVVLHLNEVPFFSTFQLFTVKIFVKESQKFAMSTDLDPTAFFNKCRLSLNLSTTTVTFCKNRINKTEKGTLWLRQQFSRALFSERLGHKMLSHLPIALWCQGKMFFRTKSVRLENKTFPQLSTQLIFVWHHSPVDFQAMESFHELFKVFFPVHAPSVLESMKAFMFLSETAKRISVKLGGALTWSEISNFTRSCCFVKWCYWLARSSNQV